MVVVQEFDLDIKPAKLVKGQGLCKLAAEAQDQVNEDSGWENEIALWCGEVAYISQYETPGTRTCLTYYIMGLVLKTSTPEREEPSD
jgi:hypothetical protein